MRASRATGLRGSQPFGIRQTGETSVPHIFEDFGEMSKAAGNSEKRTMVMPNVAGAHALDVQAKPRARDTPLLRSLWAMRISMCGNGASCSGRGAVRQGMSEWERGRERVVRPLGTERKDVDGGGAG